MRDRARDEDKGRKRMRRDKMALEKENYLERPDPDCLTYGPKTRRQFLNFLGRSG